VGEQLVVERPQVEVLAEGGLGLRPHLHDPELTDLVGQRLPRHRDVAIDLVDDVQLRLGRVLPEVGDRPLPVPALGVNPGVHHQPGRAQNLSLQPAQVSVRIVVIPAQLGCQLLGVKRPAFGVGGVRGDRAVVPVVAVVAGEVDATGDAEGKTSGDDAKPRAARCAVTAVPCTTPAAEILGMQPDGILLSPGPGDPELLDYIVATIKQLVGRKPIMGICLGNQLIARAFGARNFKLKFGHRGGNHPVRELETGRIHITAQNHGYAVDPETLKGSGLEVTHINLNDGTVEGLRHKELPIFCIQYHSEASPGPLDNTYLFEKFINMIEGKFETN